MKEVLRVVLFLLIIGVYLSSLTGALIGLIHLILMIYNPRRFGISRILNHLLSEPDKRDATKGRTVESRWL
ncbi:MAG: hypothetical protein EA409_13775 [Saprospirales bacterium]|nr:MAG: hypothetical protein EA409_13775 [Saprospirales bacterium]